MPVTDEVSIRAVLEADSVAVVGCSTTRGKPAHDVPDYLLEQGYDVIPVNPYAETVLGREALESVADVRSPVDVVCVFRPSDEVEGIVDAVLDRADEPVIWTQLGIVDGEAAARAERAGLRVVQDRCMKLEHRRLLG